MEGIRTMSGSSNFTTESHKWVFKEMLPATFWKQYPTALYKCVDCEAVKIIYMDVLVADPKFD